ncbi:MAG TPA: hypothetical protein VER03_07490 [Bryobacteraceae bacterium]|nr:hypothetical protein [Bryobacteraceae bacterium]
MPEANENRRFIFRGNAMPFGGRILQIGKRKVNEGVPGPACAALPVVGGRVRATTRGASWGDAFKWGPTVAESIGELRDDGSHVTTVTCSMANFFAKNDPHVFEADQLRATLVSTHPPTGEPAITAKELLFGSREKGMTLNGHRIELECEDDLSLYPTFTDFKNGYRKKRDFFDLQQKTISRTGEGKFGEAPPRAPNGYVTTSIVRRIHFRKKTIEGHVLYFKGFGSIYFGEVLMNENNRRFTMVRLEMGSSMRASMAAVETDPNGIWSN